MMYGEVYFRQGGIPQINYYLVVEKDGLGNKTTSIKVRGVNSEGQIISEEIVVSINGTENLDILAILFVWSRNDIDVETEITELKTNLEEIRTKLSNAGGGEEILNGFSVMSKKVYCLKVQKDNAGNVVTALVKKPISLLLNESKSYQSSAGILKGAVSGIYKTLRTVAIVALLTILVYVGIRMVLASASKEKSKYKQMIIDWLVALILVFVLHYLMAFIINISQKLTGLVEGSSIENVMLQIPNGTRMVNSEGENERLDAGDENSDFWGTNFIGMIRFYAGLVQKKGYTVKGISYTLMYVVMVIYMVIFTFQYLKRVLYMAFLTMISPLVAITYPLDKLNDGKAQGFSMWLREYIFNSLLQPIHCIIYVVVIGSAMQLVVDYPLYGLIAIGFMVPAEKFIRKMFGFEKASTVGGFGAVAGTAALMGAMQKLAHRPHRRNNNEKGEKEKLGDGNENRGIRTIDSIPSIGDATNFQADNKSAWHSKLTAEQKDELIENGIEPGDAEYYNALRNYGIRDNEEMMSQDTTDSEQAKTSRIEKMQNGVRKMLDSKFMNSKFISGSKSVAGHYARRLNGRLKKSHPIRALRRGVTYGLGAATLGTIGLAAGIASGDASKALQYTMAGGMAGGGLTRNIGDKASNVLEVDSAMKSFRAGYLGDKYDEKERKKYNKSFKNNVSNYDTAVKKVSANGWEEMSKNGGIIDSALDYGINDISTMCNIYKTQQKLMSNGKGEEAAKEAAFRAYKLNSQFGDYSSNSKTQENLDKVINSKGYSNSVKDKTKKEILDLIKIYKNIARD